MVAFHSLEDRIVKHTFRALQARQVVKVLTKRPIAPGVEEVHGQSPRPLRGRREVLGFGRAQRGHHVGGTGRIEDLLAHRLLLEQARDVGEHTDVRVIDNAVGAPDSHAR